MPNDPKAVFAACAELRRTLRVGLGTDGVSEAMAHVVAESVRFLRHCRRERIESLVDAKRYAFFRLGNAQSRAVNDDLYQPDDLGGDAIRGICNAELDRVPPEIVDRLL